MKGLLRLFGWALLTVSALAAAAGGAGWLGYREITGSGPLLAARTVVIPPGTGLAGVAELLAKEGVVRHRLAFEISAILLAKAGGLQAGEYRFPAEASPLAAAAIIASGKTVKHRLTIPEGLTTAEVLALVNAAPGLAGDIGLPPAEGSLMPDTYQYTYGEPRRELILRMQRAMAQALRSVWEKRRPDLPLSTPEQLLTLASIVEREAKHADDRPRIAAVFLNRLRLSMPLDSDPTVIYALSDAGAKKFDRALTHADLQTPSSYNTYLEKGLPPGPIDNPGMAALRAVAQPATTDELYFVADGNGGHVFAHTLAEQDRNIAQYRRAAASAPDRSGAGQR